jgi:ubiquinone/menaquinone biosynthesis C-methylase UbiE
MVGGMTARDADGLRGRALQAGSLQADALPADSLEADGLEADGLEGGTLRADTLRADILQKEQTFHDQWAAAIDVDGIRVADYFEACTAPENRFIVQHLGNIQGQYLLDLGCGAGENSVYFALQGARCVAADYSPGMVEVALKLAQANGVTVEGCTVNAMAIAFPDNSFDIVYASNLLHHIPDPVAALREIHRVLKPGGKACFWDPLRHNPVINVYRRIATEVRTEDEMPLDIGLVQSVRSLFSQTYSDTFWIATLWIFLRFYLIERVNPNQERYWKKIISEHERLAPTYRRLEAVDRWLKKVPGLRRMAWNVAVVAVK